MKAEELAFVNQQLAEMLRSGIPLEGALRQLCADMQRGDLRRELELLTADLANGTPLTQALAARKLPAFYIQMLNVGVASNDLPGVLTLVADYYERASSIWTRLKGLMVYPFILLGGLVLVATVMAVIAGVVRRDCFGVYDLNRCGCQPAITRLFMEYGQWLVWIPVVVTTAGFVAAGAALAVPSLRERWRWKLPAFRDASLWQCASAMQMMLRSSCTLNQAIGLMQELERGTPAAPDLAQWRERLKAGESQFQQIASGSQVFPPLFVWIVNNAREEMGDGFRQAAEIYHQRAIHRVEALLYAALPVSVVVLGLAVFMQAALYIYALFNTLISWL
jgi:type II secretory pathway component PulF